jgi:proteic killer suppression protein
MFEKLLYLMAPIFRANIRQHLEITNITPTFGVSNVKRYNIILSFKRNRKIWNGIRVKKMPIEIQNVGRRKLRMLNNSQDIADLRIPPSNRLEKLSGKLNEFYSIRINKQWRIIFIWDKGNASEVEIIDYH